MKRYDYYCSQIRFFDNLYNRAKAEGKIIRINDELCIDVNTSEIVSRGCKTCGNVYCDISFGGYVYENDEMYAYWGDMKSRGLMCKCGVTDEEWNNFELNPPITEPGMYPVDSLLFDIYIEREHEYLWRIYISDRDKIELMETYQ